MRINKTPVAQPDEPFLLTLYSETRDEELSPVPWTEEQKQIFLQHQFQSQHQHYIAKYPDGVFQIINLDQTPVGRLYTAELADEIRIIDITILAEFRGQNIGTTLLEEILTDAEKKNKPVQIYLDAGCRSAGLFTRLGFRPVADEGVYQLWRRDRIRTAGAV